MSPRARGWAWMLAIAGTVVALDQASKGAVVSALELGERADLVLGLEIAHVTNRGIAFGLLADGQGLVVAVTVTTLAVLVAWFATAAERPGMWVGIGMLVGGALGNLADRVRADAVTDFIDPPGWPAFNLADVAITLGVAVIALTVIASSGPGRREGAASAEGGGAGHRPPGPRDSVRR